MYMLAGFFFGFGVGGLIIDSMWKAKIREKATSKFRLEANGALYDVRFADQDGQQSWK